MTARGISYWIYKVGSGQVSFLKQLCCFLKQSSERVLLNVSKCKDLNIHPPNLIILISLGVPVMAPRTPLVSMRIQVQSLALLSGLRIWCCSGLWIRLVAAALIWPLAWEPPYAAKTKQNKTKKNKVFLYFWAHMLYVIQFCVSGLVKERG